MRLAEFRAFLKEKKESPLYLLAGREDVLTDRLEQAIKKDVLGPSSSEFNFTRFYGSVHSASQIVQEAQQISILSSKRLIVVKEADQFAKEDQEFLAEYCESPVPSATVVFIAPTMDKRTKFYKTLIQKAVLLDCDSPPPQDLKEWVAERCRKEEKSITPDAVEWLVEHSGNQLTFLASELEKLLLYCRAKSQITESDVEQIGSKNPVKTVFNLCDAISARKKDEAFAILRELQQEGIAVPQLVGLLRWQLSRLWSGVRQFGEERMSRAYEAILSADEEVKSGTGNEKIVLDSLLYRLMK